MAKKEKREAKERIFEAATSLFARKGYAAVGTREIAKEADVNVSMINYYYEGKLGILKEIINECYDKYFRAISDADDKDAPPEGRVRLIARGLVDFFKGNTELAMAGFSVFPIDEPEIVDLKVKWATDNRKVTAGLFEQLGVDMDDTVQSNVVRGLLTGIIQSHFRFKYAWKHMVEAAARSGQTWERITEEPQEELDDAFYEKYSDMLADLYLHGLTSITSKKQPTKGGNSGTKNL